MNSVRILSQYQLFYQQLEIKLIHLVKYFVFWEISWEWWESLKVINEISGERSWQKCFVTCGVLHDSISGPTFFLLYIIGLLDNITSNFSFCGDETTLYSKVSSSFRFLVAARVGFWAWIWPKTHWKEVESGMLVSIIPLTSAI